ncbi:unannotated protein [freshwater metagenome]|uniref:Unannotated protein n=1 Tax=freshwater metagenome TaxID=449393 RepID=A0A6J5YKL2_9ZZZZ
MTDLTEDLGLTDHGGIDSGSNAEQMLDRLRTVVHVEMIGDLLGRGEGQVGEERTEIGVGRVELLGHHIDLSAVACGEHDCLAHMLMGDHIVQCLRETGVVDRDALEQRQRHCSVVQPENDYRHVGVVSFDPARGCSRKTPSFPETAPSCQFSCRSPVNRL